MLSSERIGSPFGDVVRAPARFDDASEVSNQGALDYIVSKGVEAFSLLTYNATGDGDNVWPFVERDAKLHYGCVKLDQWGMVFNHATALGLYLHFKPATNGTAHC